MSVCKADKLPKTPLQKQHSDDLATDKTDTQVESNTLEVSEPGDLLTKAVLYVSQLLRRVSSRWSSS